MTEETGSTSCAWANVELHESWREVLGEEFNKDYMRQLRAFLESERQKGTVYPDDEEIFAAFNTTPFCDVKAVIIGQDPYYGGQAHGLSFSVRQGKTLQPSLANILHEVNCDMSHDDVPGGKRNRVVPAGKGCLTPWAKQGVLLLNAVLTVADGCPDSHSDHGWETFTDRVVKVVNEKREHLVFLLWGEKAKSKGQVIDRKRHRVLKAPHPGRQSAWRGFFGSHHFSKTNQYLVCHGKTPIDWFNVD